MTATKGAEHANTPSMQAVDNPRRPIHRMQRTRGSTRANARMCLAVSSAEASSTNISSQFTFGRAASSNAVRGLMLSRSLRVGTTIVKIGAAFATFGGCTDGLTGNESAKNSDCAEVV